MYKWVRCNEEDKEAYHISLWGEDQMIDTPMDEDIREALREIKDNCDGLSKEQMDLFDAAQDVAPVIDLIRKYYDDTAELVPVKKEFHNPDNNSDHGN